MQIGGSANLNLIGGNNDAGKAQIRQDLKKQEEENNFQEEVSMKSNLEAKRNQTRMSVIGNMK